jgi:hypothetical protein
MTIEIHSPEVEAIIHSRMKAAQNAEDVILQALKALPAAEAPAADTPRRAACSRIRHSKASISILSETPIMAATLRYERFPAGHQPPFGTHPSETRAAG